jgi:AcrR family transcriptional regulator
MNRSRAVLGSVPPPARAPTRGRYDRTLSADDRGRAQRRRILDAAADVFAARGFAGASVEQIVSLAGMSRKTFYEHFKDLTDVLLKLHDRSASLAYRFVEAAVRSEEEPIAQIRAGVRAFLGIISEYADLSRVVFREMRAAGPEYEVHRDIVLQRYVSLLFERLTEAYRSDLIVRPPDELTLYTLVSGLESVAMRYVSRREEARATEAVEPLVQLILRAFS